MEAQQIHSYALPTEDRYFSRTKIRPRKLPVRQGFTRSCYTGNPTHDGPSPAAFSSRHSNAYNAFWPTPFGTHGHIAQFREDDANEEHGVLEPAHPAFAWWLERFVFTVERPADASAQHAYCQVPSTVLCACSRVTSSPIYFQERKRKGAGCCPCGNAAKPCRVRESWSRCAHRLPKVGTAYDRPRGVQSSGTTQ
jgi:hypothetical protein